MMYRHPAALSDEQIEAAVELYKPGVSIGDVAAQLGLTWSAAQLRLSHAGVIRSRSDTLRLSSKLKRLSADVEDDIVKRYVAGGSCVSVGHEVGVSPASVSAVLARRGVAARKQRGGRRRSRPREAPKPVERERVGAVAAAPLAAALLAQIRHRERFALDGEGRKEVCASAGIDPRQLFAWQSGEIRKAHFDVADRVLTRTGKLWWTVYDPQAHGPGLFADRQRDDVLKWIDAVDRAALMWEGEPALETGAVNGAYRTRAR
jgi:hypothetical protein